MRLQPYQNDHIITAIQVLYFAGGAKSFAKQFQYLFPTYETHKGEVCEVPIHMVALVATVVRRCFCLDVYSHCYIQAVCNTSGVVHRRTSRCRILGQCLLGCIQRSCQHVEAHPGEARRGVPSDDGQHLHTGKVSINYFFGHCSTDTFDMAAKLQSLNQTRLSQLLSSISMASMDSVL
jgi:hypothetical protein